MTSTLVSDQLSSSANISSDGPRIDRAIVIDECPLFRRGISAALYDVGVKVFAETDRGTDGLHSLRMGIAGLVIVGTQLDVTTIATVRRAKAMKSKPVVMALLGRADAEDLQSLRELGTDALLTRQAQVADIQLAFSHLVRGEHFIAAAPLAMLVGNGKSFDANGSHLLTRREMEIIRRLAEGYSNNEIAQLLVVSLPTVKTHLSHIYDKLDVRNRRDAVGRALQIGLLA